jgi:hypothetical protein
VKVNGNKVLEAKRRGSKVKPGTLTVKVTCDRAAKLALSGQLTRLIGKKPAHGRPRSKTERLGTVSRTLGGAAAVQLTVKLPADAVKALGAKASESVAFTLAATNAGGTSRVTAKVRQLIGIH